MSIATAWASRIMTVSLEMVLPGLAGLWLDGVLGSRLVFTLLGFAVGMTTAIWHLLRMTSADSNSVSGERSADAGRSEGPPQGGPRTGGSAGDGASSGGATNDG